MENSRKLEFDLAKTLAIVAMVITHIGEEFGFEPYVGEPWFHLVAAPLFMFSMGVTMLFTSHDSPEEFTRRGVHLIVLGYVLNFFRATVWLIIGKLAWDREPWGIVESFATLDILHFAGLAFLAVALLRKMKCPAWGMLAVSLAMLAAAPFLDTHEEWMTSANYFQGYLWRAHGEACFPLFNWFVFPCLGLFFGSILKEKVKNPQIFYSFLLAIAATLLFVSVIIFRIYDVDVFSYIFDLEKYYSMNLATVSMHCLAILTVVSICYFAMKKVTGKLRDAVIYVSKNLNNIYITQWIIIESFYTIWLITTLQSFRVPVCLSVPVGMAVSALSIIIVVIINRYKTTN